MFFTMKCIIIKISRRNNEIHSLRRSVNSGREFDYLVILICIIYIKLSNLFEIESYPFLISPLGPLMNSFVNVEQILG